MMRQKAKFKFSGHQAFTFRYGWLEKGGRGVAVQPNLFSRDDALVNQVRRYVRRTAKGDSPSAVPSAIMRVMQEIDIP